MRAETGTSRRNSGHPSRRSGHGDAHPSDGHVGTAHRRVSIYAATLKTPSSWTIQSGRVVPVGATTQNFSETSETSARSRADPVYGPRRQGTPTRGPDLRDQGAPLSKTAPR